MDAEQQSKIAEFCAVSGADTERASFFLQAANWETELAISTFFENEGELPSHEEFIDDEPSASFQSHTQRSHETPPEAAAQSAPSSTSQPKSRIQTFSNWSGAQQADQEEESDDDDQGQAYYAGGSDQSGQQILGPPRKDGKKNRKVVEELFKSAKQHGAQAVAEAGRTDRLGSSHFSGTGYRLGESETEASRPVAGAAKKKEPVSVILRLWKTGFTVNDGPLRSFQDPQNRPFLDSIHKGEVPHELVEMAQGGEVEMDMEDRRTEDYVPPKQPKVRAFTGSGQTLGSDLPTQASTSSASVATSASAVTLDTSLPVTSVQIRLADGSRLVAKFNHSHTIGDIRSHIAANRPEYVGVAFSLVTTLPSRHLTDDTATIKDADLLNAVIMQKL